MLRLDSQIQCTPLHLAAYKGDVAIIKALLFYRAGMEAKDEDNYTPLHIVSQNGYITAIKQLIDSRAKS